MREYLQLGPFDPVIRLPFILGLELNRTIIDTVHMYSAETGPESGGAFEGLTIEQGTYKAGRVCCRSSIAHQVAFCRAVEDAFCVEVEPEVELFRVLVAELERIAAHLEIFADVARYIEDGLIYSSAVKFIQEIRSSFKETTGNPFCFGLVVPGGVAINNGSGKEVPVYGLTDTISDIVRDMGLWAGKLRIIKGRFNSARLDRSSIPDGAMSAPAFRASGIGIDMRCGEGAYGAYRDLAVDVETGREGLTSDRLLVLLGEIISSAGIIRKVYGSGMSFFREPAEVEIRSGKGVGFSEGPHGAVEYNLAIDSRAVIRKCSLCTAAADVTGVLPKTIQGISYDDVVTTLLSFSPCPFCPGR